MSPRNWTWYSYRHVKLSHCNWLGNHSILVKYNKISQLGLLNGDPVCFIEVKFTVNEETKIFLAISQLSIKSVEHGSLIYVVPK